MDAEYPKRSAAGKDASGQPRISPEQHFIIDPLKQEAFNEKLSDLHKAYKDELEIYQKAAKDIDVFLSGDSGVTDLPKIPLSALKNNISMVQMEALFPLLESEVHG